MTGRAWWAATVACLVLVAVAAVSSRDDRHSRTHSPPVLPTGFYAAIGSLAELRQASADAQRAIGGCGNDATGRSVRECAEEYMRPVVGAAHRTAGQLDRLRVERTLSDECRATAKQVAATIRADANRYRAGFAAGTAQQTWMDEREIDTELFVEAVYDSMRRLPSRCAPDR